MIVKENVSSVFLWKVYTKRIHHYHNCICRQYEPREGLHDPFILWSKQVLAQL